MARYGMPGMGCPGTGDCAVVVFRGGKVGVLQLLLSYLGQQWVLLQVSGTHGQPLSCFVYA